MIETSPTVTRFEPLSRYSTLASLAYSTSPQRREIVHHAEPIVERVVEYENFCTPELMARAASKKVEVE